ncbi:hypothetical protein GDO81_016407 [Engystomops pustulosus]|uniref:PDZ domain-containing protein n=1 Tax=Engystomops pustulosus TaxID=76066 RepID=A0AAV7AWD7_ENGPU|nr:hypothetical protein GDO81_016407 [Engystomops pustulosus]
MEEEDTRELLLPNWKGSGTMGLTLDQNAEGVYVKQLVQNSPAAKTGVVREGDQVVGATVYFDNMSSEDIEKLLANVGQHTVGLKLHRKGDRSPQPGVTYSHDVFSLKSPDVVLSGDDEEYRRIYTKKIKPRLKSEDGLEPETQTRTITVTRKVTAYTVDVTGSKDTKEIDISSPEYKIKIPRHEITEISKTSVDTEEGKTMIRIPGIDVSGKSRQTSGEYSVSLPGDTMNVHTTTVRYQGQSGAQFEYPEGELSRQTSAGIHLPDISVSGPKFQSYEKKIDVKMSRFGAEHDFGLRDPNFRGASEDIGLEVKTPDYNASTAAGNIKESQGTGSVTSRIGFQTSSTTIKGAKFDIKTPEVGSSAVNVRIPETDINISSTQSVGPKLDGQFKLSHSSGDGLAATGAHMDITPGFEGKAITSSVNLAGPTVDFKGTDIELENSGGNINIPSFKVPKFGFSETSKEFSQPDLSLDSKSEKWAVKVPKIDMPKVSIDTKGSSGRMETEVSDIGLQRDLNFGVKGPQIKIATEVGQGHVETTEVGAVEGNIKMPKFNLPRFGVPESKLEGGINLSGPQADLVSGGAIDLKGPSVDVKTPSLDITSQVGSVEGGHLTKPSVSVSLPKIPKPDMDITLKGPKEIDISKPKVNITGPTVETEVKDISIGGRVENVKFEVPPVQLPKAKVDLKGPTIEGNLEALTGSIKVPDVDIAGPKVDLGASEGKISMPKFKMPKFGISDSNFERPQVDVNLPKVDVNTIDAKMDVDGSTHSVNVSLPKVPEVDLGFKGPKLDGKLKSSTFGIKSTEADLQAPDLNLGGKVKGPTLQMQGVSLPKVSMSDLDLNVKGPTFEKDLKAPKVDIKVPEVGLEGKMKGPNFQLPSVNMPDSDLSLKGPKISVPSVDLNLTGSKLGGGVKGPNVEIKGPEVDFKAPDVEFERPKFNLPSVPIPKMPMPNVDLHLQGPKLESDLKGEIKCPDVEIKAPEVDLEAPDINIKDPEGKIKMPKFKMPKFGSKAEVNLKGPEFDIKAPEVELGSPNVDVDLNLKTPKVKGDIKGPKVQVKAPGLDIDLPDIDTEGKVRDSKFKIPSMNFPDVSMDLKGPNWKGGAKGSLPKVEGEVEGPNADINIPDIDTGLKIEGPEGKIKMPKFKMPSFGFSGQNVEGPEGDISLPKAELDLSVPDVDIEAPEIKVKGSKFKMPSMNFNLPKKSKHDVDLNIKGPSIEGDLKVPKVEVKAPVVEPETPDFDLEGKVKGPKFKMPSVNIPKMPDLHLKGPKLEGDVKCPDVDIEGPKIDLEGPDVDLDGKVKGSKFKMPSVNLPSMPDFHLKGPKLEGDVKGPKVDIKGPEVDLECPDVDLDGKVKGPKLEGDVKGPKVPKLEGDVKGPKVDIKGPEVDLEGPIMPDFHLKGPKLEGDVKGPKIDIKGPEVGLEGPDVDLDGKVKGPKFKMPSVNLPSMPDFHLKGPKLEGDVKGPKVDIKGPEVDLEGPDVDLDGKIKGPKFKMPSVNLPSMPDFHLKGPKLEGDVRGPKVDIKGPEVDLEGPDVDLDGKVKDIDLKGPKMKVPSLDMNMPKISMPDIDLNLKGPKLKAGADIEGGTADIKLPKLEGDLEGAGLDLEVPSGNLETSDGKLKMPKFKMPKFGFSGPSAEMSGVDVGMSGPKLDIKTPELGVEIPEGKVKSPKIKIPDVDLSVKGPNLKGGVDAKLQADIKNPNIDIKGPELNMPSPSLSVELPEGKGDGLDIDASLPKGEIDISCPNVDIKAPEVDIEGPEGKLKGPNFKLPSMDIHLPKVSMPDLDLNLKGPKGDLDVTGPKLEGDLKIPAVDVDVDIPEGSLKLPKVKKPKFGFGIKSPKAEVKASSVDVNVPEVDFDAEIPEVSVSGKGKKGKFKMPKIHMSGPKVKGKKAGFDVNAPDMDNDINLNAPDVDLNVSGGDAGIKTDIGLKAPKTRKPLFGKIHFPDVEFDIKSPKLKGDASLQSPKADIKTPDLEIGGGVKVPDVDLTTSAGSIEGPDIKMKKTKFKLPGFSMSGPKVEVPEADLSLSKGNIDLSGPKIDIGTSGTMSIKNDLPNLSIDTSAPQISVPDIDVNLQGPKFKADKVGSINVDLNSPNLGISGSTGKISLPEVGITGSSTGRSEINFDTKLKTPNLDGSIEGPSIKTPAVDITLPKVTGPEIDTSFKGPKIEGDFGSSSGIDLPGINVKGASSRVELSGPQVKLPKGEFSLSRPEAEISGSTGVSGLNLKGPSLNVSGQDINLKGDLAGGAGYLQGPSGLRIQGTKVEGDLTGPKVEGGWNVKPIDLNLEGSSGKITFPRLLMPKFTTSEPEPSGREVGVDVDFPSANVQLAKPGQADVDLESDIKIKKSKIKMPKLNFKSKGKVDANLPDVSVSGAKGELQSSKASLGSVEGGVGSATLEVDKPAKYEFSLFTSKKTRHRSSSLSEEKDESTHSSPSGTLDAGASLSAEGGKKKGKHSKIKFGTFGGLGSKSKGSYEVTLSDDENVQGSGASLSSRKSRVSSSSSNDSATKAGVRLPKVELTVAKKKE